MKGDTFSEILDNTQTCLKHGCKLTKMRVWKDELRISGFEAIFEYPNSENWEPEVLTFGTKALAVGYEEKKVTEEILSVGLGFDS